MRLPNTVLYWLRDHLITIANKREPDYIIGQSNNPYMQRWWIIPRNRFFNIYLHKIIRSDDDRALHCHPFDSLSILLYNKYIEHTISQGGVHNKRLREAGNIVARYAEKAHRLEVNGEEPTWSLFITGPRRREWYFHCIEKGKILWSDFVNPKNTGEIGRGCD